MANQETQVLPIVEEELVIGKIDTVTGKIRVQTLTDFVEEVASLDLARDEVEVEHVEINRQVAEVPPVRVEGETTIIPVVEEVLVVEKRLMLKQELHVRRRVTTERVDVPVTLRKQRAVVERIDANSATHIEEEVTK